MYGGDNNPYANQPYQWNSNVQPSDSYYVPGAEMSDFPSEHEPYPGWQSDSSLVQGYTQPNLYHSQNYISDANEYQAGNHSIDIPTHDHYPQLYAASQELVPTDPSGHLSAYGYAGDVTNNNIPDSRFADSARLHSLSSSHRGNAENIQSGAWSQGGLPYGNTISAPSSSQPSMHSFSSPSSESYNANPAIFLPWDGSAEPPASRARPGTTNRACSHCGATSTPLWRRDPQNLQTLCNACGLYLQQRKTMRPLESMQGNLDSLVNEEDAQQDSRVKECAHCHTRQSSAWRRGNSGERLCNACGVYARTNGTDRPLSLKYNRVKRRGKGDTA